MIPVVLVTAVLSFAAGVVGYSCWLDWRVRRDWPRWKP